MQSLPRVPTSYIDNIVELFIYLFTYLYMLRVDADPYLKHNKTANYPERLYLDC